MNSTQHKLLTQQLDLIFEDFCSIHQSMSFQKGKWNIDSFSATMHTVVATPKSQPSHYNATFIVRFSPSWQLTHVSVFIPNDDNCRISYLPKKVNEMNMLFLKNAIGSTGIAQPEAIKTQVNKI